jgi:hypothetical protein
MLHQIDLACPSVIAFELTDPRTQRWIVAAARRQRDCPGEWFE